MKIQHRFLFAFVVPLFSLLLQTSHTFAQDVPEPAESQQGPEHDPPTRVARLNYSSGSVSFQPGGEGDWVTAVQNRPLTTGDNLWSDQNSRAELHVGSTAIRMSSETSLTFLDLDDHTTQLRLSLGSLLLRVRHLDDGDLFEVDTPNLAFTVQSAGEYRIDVNSDGNQTITTVWRGHAEATGGGYSYTVIAGQQATFNGTDQLDHEIAQLPRSDDFEAWAFDRDAREDHADSSNYISAEMTGYEDLDDYGRWRYVPEYGPVWTPVRVVPGWAPYRFGHWVWVAPWGWTWVEDEPWGFAPFHYGRWAFVDSGWCWVPGPVYVRPVYAPALVAFVGGGGFHLAIGVGEGVAWFPLGPREVYVPPYRVSRVYVNNINITNTRVNVTQVTNVYNNYTVNKVTNITYVNQHVNNAVTVVSHETFVNARPVDKNLAHADARQLEQAPITHSAPVQPVRSSLIGAGTPARFHPPAAIENRRVVATRNPTPPRAPFEQQRQAMNVRTETPTQPRPAGESQPNRGEPARNAQSEPQRNNPPEPQRNIPQEAQRNVPRPTEPNRPQEPSQPTRQPETQRPENRVPENRMPENQPPAEAQRSNVPRPSPGYQPPAYQNRNYNEQPHPLVRQAPPPQPRPQVDQNEANKFRTWQQQRPPENRSAPRQQESRAPQPPRNDHKK
jgi:FecR protein